MSYHEEYLEVRWFERNREEIFWVGERVQRYRGIIAYIIGIVKKTHMVKTVLFRGWGIVI